MSSQADVIRQFVFDRYLAGEDMNSPVVVRAGDVHRDLGLTNSMPAVCSALGGDKLSALANVELIDRVGPRNGANVYFHFVRASSRAEQAATERPEHRVDKNSPTILDKLSLAGALVLVSCVKSKLPHAAPARELYDSVWFNKARSIVEASGARWMILSAYHGLVEPRALIDTYEFTLNGLGIQGRRAWAAEVMAQLAPIAKDYERVVFFAGARYREFLAPALEDLGVRVETPMVGLKLGEQLRWLATKE